MTPFQHRCATFSVAALTVLGARPVLADAPEVLSLRIQKVGDITYFHVRFATPEGMVTLKPDDSPLQIGTPFTEPVADLTPRLVCPDGQLRLICRRGEPGNRGLPAPRMVVHRAASEDGLEFLGRTASRGTVSVKLLYPVEGRRRSDPAEWRESEVKLDFATAKEVPSPKAVDRRRRSTNPVADDIEGLWAVAQVNQFQNLANESADFGFYSFAATATARKYGAAPPAPPAPRPWMPPGDPDASLYNMTTGSSAITESLQLRRMNPTPRGKGDDERTTPIANVGGITVAEHPWKKMIGEKEPAPEPLAAMIPHDNYYVRFGRVDRLVAFAGMVDLWGGNITRSYDPTSREERIRSRYETQLCLPSDVLVKTLTPDVVSGVAITGSDAYLRDGSDVAVLFEVKNGDVFTSSIKAAINEIRRKFGDRVKETKNEYDGVEVRSLVTPLREVSLHAATLGDVVVHANSLTGLRRILDVKAGKGKRLSDSLDFRYMRTVFRADDTEEDGFAFLSDAFIRTQVGPRSKIGQKRRLEALVSLRTLSHAALLTAWESGKAPANEEAILDSTSLRQTEIPMPEGKPAVWDVKEQQARSEAYNTVGFATPLIELPMDQVTPTEAAEYERFRLEYLGLWRQYFDPVGMRLKMRDGEVKLETYLLPLVNNSVYNNLRRVTGSKTIRFDPASIPAQTIFQYLIRLNPDAEARGSLLNQLRGAGPWWVWATSAFDFVGDWALVRVNDSPAFEKLAILSEKQDRGESVSTEEMARVVWSLPIGVAVDVKNPLTLSAALASVRMMVKESLPNAVTWGPLEKKYKEVSIVCIQATRAGRNILDNREDNLDPFLPAIYYALVDGGLYITLNEAMMHQFIDAARTKTEGKGAIRVASSLHVSPKAAVHARKLILGAADAEAHRHARAALPVWYALYRSGVIPEAARPEQAAQTAYRFLGYVPVSPDVSAYRYDRGLDEVVNERHGSLRQPIRNRPDADGSPMRFLMEQITSVRADLRFREDGVHTTLTLRAKDK
jgi:hypothetical protein